VIRLSGGGVNLGGVVEAQPFYEKTCGALVIPGSERGIYG